MNVIDALKEAGYVATANTVGYSRFDPDFSGWLVSGADVFEVRDGNIYSGDLENLETRVILGPVYADNAHLDTMRDICKIIREKTGQVAKIDCRWRVCFGETHGFED